MARLSFSNVPSPSGGVISGNVSIASGSPFGKGGEFAGKIAHVQSEIAKMPKGYYDPQESFDTQSKTIDNFLSLKTNDFESVQSRKLNEAYWNTRHEQTRLDIKLRLDAEREREKTAQADAHVQGVLARLQNGELIAPPYFQNNIILWKNGIISSEELLSVYQAYVTNKTIHKPIIVEKPIPVDIPPKKIKKAVEFDVAKSTTTNQIWMFALPILVLAVVLIGGKK